MSDEHTSGSAPQPQPRPQPQPGPQMHQFVPPPYGMYAPPPPPRSGWSIFHVFAILLAVGIAGMVCLAILIGVLVAIGTAMQPQVPPALQGYDEKTLLQGDGFTDPKIAMIPVTGGISGVGSHLDGAGNAFTAVQMLRRAAMDKKVEAVLLCVDSPGGGLTASDLIHNEIVNLKEQGKTVVVYVGDLAASGGYYISAPADYIIASPTSQVGSFGVIMYRFQIDQMMKMLGIKPEPIKSTEMKDIGSPFRDLTPEEKEYFQGMIKGYHERFVSIIAEGRNLPTETVAELANGKIYTAEQAKEYGLIDEIGYFDAALQKTAQMAALGTEPRVVTYTRRISFQQQFLHAEAPALEQLAQRIEWMLSGGNAPRVMAVWHTPESTDE